MYAVSPTDVILFLQDLPPEALGVLSFVLGGVLVLSLFARFGVLGLVVYNVVAVLAANVQVLKTAQFALLDTPVALGTTVSASCFLAVDLATEYYGPEVAQRLITVGFVASILWLLWMLLVLGVKPYAGNMVVHEALYTLFVPTPAIVVASLCAYVASQKLEIQLFQKIKNYTGTRALWLRSSVSMCLSAFCDTAIFSILAWVVLAPMPVSWDTLIWTYILGTFVFRITALIGNVGIMYLARRFKKKSNDAQLLSQFSI